MMATETAPTRTGLVQRAFRPIARFTLRSLLQAATHLRIQGLQNIPSDHAAILAFNHLGHLDSLLLVAFAPRAPECMALSDLMNVPITKQALRAYGVILVHRDEYDRKVIRAALGALERGNLLALAPEARQSPSAAMEKGRPGAAYLALKSGALVVPVGITGTQAVYAAWQKRRRPKISMTVGQPFHVPTQPGAKRGETLEAAHCAIMQHIAQLLPADYQGYWRQANA